MTTFKKIYVWGMNTKLFMGIYFTAIVFLGGILTAIYGGDVLRLATLLQMLLISVLIAFAQSVLLPDSTDYAKSIFFARSVGWLLFAGIVTGLCASLGGWFAGLPAWCPPLMGLFVAVGCASVLVGVKLEQAADTLRLNDTLQQYQQKNEQH